MVSKFPYIEWNRTEALCTVVLCGSVIPCPRSECLFHFSMLNHYNEILEFLVWGPFWSKVI